MARRSSSSTTAHLADTLPAEMYGRIRFEAVTVIGSTKSTVGRKLIQHQLMAVPMARRLVVGHLVVRRLIIREGDLKIATEAESLRPMMHTGADNRRSVVPGGMTLKILSVVLLIGFASLGCARAQEPGQRTFATPKAAAAALAAAAQTNNEEEMLAILGPSAKDVISSGDPVADKRMHELFARRYSELHQFARDDEGRVFLYVGPANWPTPIPLEERDGRWYFDTAYGKKQILYRRIGFNELYAIRVCRAIVNAQREYHAGIHGGSVHQYAQKFRSDPGTQDGLYWTVKPGEPKSPLGPLVAKASRQGYQHHAGGQPQPFHGYIYALLKQGPNAPGGAKDYVVDGRMTGGFAVIAYPARYADSGVMTFLVNQDGQIYQKDLGPETDQIASAVTAYNPDATWSRVETGLQRASRRH